MANFCMKCGHRLQKDNLFCPMCGTAVPDSDVWVTEDGKGGLKIEAPEGSVVAISDPGLDGENGIKVTEDGKGGLVFEVPEGSTVEITDSMPTKEMPNHES